MVYCHGGLNDEKASASRIASMLPYLLANEIYPLHFMWETGFLDSVLGIVEDAFRRGRFQGWTDDMKERFYDLLDEGIRSEEHTSELQSLMRTSSAVFCL